MPYSSDSLILSELEQKIGMPSGNTSSFITINSDSRIALRAWLVAKGIDSKTANKCSDDTLSKAYKSPNYLAAMLRNIKPTRTRPAAEGIDFDLEEMNSTQAAKPQTDSSLPPDLAHKIAQAADLVITPRIAAAKRDLEFQIDHKIKKANLELSYEARESLYKTVTEVAECAGRKLIAELLPPRRIEIHDPKSGSVRDVGLQHFKFETLLKCCSVRLPSGFRPNIWLTGPTGSGKTTACEQVAKALGVEFFIDSSLDADYKIIGFRDAKGEVAHTTFRKAFTRPCVYVMDEIDNWSPSALLSANAPLANNICSFPDETVRRHPDCIVIACANTWGFGATNDYVGRTKLDAASLNRFLPKIDWPIDEKLETALSRDQGEDALKWCQTVQFFRAKARAQGLHVIISPRDTLSGIALLQAGFEVPDVIQMTFAASLKPEQVKALGIGSYQDDETEKKAQFSYAYGGRS